MSKNLKCAVVGYGGMGSWHANKMRELDFLDLVGVYDIKQDRRALAESRGIRAFPTREALLADPEIEIVTVATPNDVHPEIAIAALDAGKNVICEKPVAMSLAEFDAMAAAAVRNNRLFTVHQNRRWDRDFRIAKKIIDDNTLGPVFHFESRVQGSRGIPGDWRNQKAHGGGMVYDWGIHLFDQLLMMTLPRKVASVYATLTNVTNEECDDGFRATVTFDDGLTAYVEVTTSNFISLPRWYVLGENGSAVIRDWSVEGEIVMVSDWENRDAVPVQAGAGLTKTMAPRTDDSIKHYPLPDVQCDWSDYYRNVYAHIREGAPIIVTHDQQRRLLKFVDAVFQSGRTNEVVKLAL